MYYCSRQATGRVLSRFGGHRSLTSSTLSSINRIPVTTRTAATSVRRFQSSTPSSSPGSSHPPPPSPPPSSAPSSSSGGGGKPETADVPTVPNLILASCLLAFVAGVFSYSMNAVGRTGDEDPLAQLRAEAEDVRETSIALRHQKKMTPEEIEQLESGFAGVGSASNRYGDGTTTMVGSVAASADTADLEDEANQKIFQQQQQRQQNHQQGDAGGGTPKKQWWRFGF